MKVRGPLITLAAVAALGAGILLVNISQEPDPAPPRQPVAESTTTAAPAPVPPPAPTPAPAAFPAKADYVGKVPTATGQITLDIAVEGDKAVAYACDGYTVESWLRGPAVNGLVSLANKDKTSRLQGRLDGGAVVGTLWIGDKKWDFTAPAAQPPAGLYVDEEAGVRNSWIVDTDGTVTGVQRGADGTTTPAPGLTADATRVEGDSDV